MYLSDVVVDLYLPPSFVSSLITNNVCVLPLGCSCRSGVCNEVTGECICPDNVVGDTCDQCIDRTFGYDPLVGCAVSPFVSSPTLGTIFQRVD